VMGFHLAAGKAIKRMAPTASNVSIGLGSGRCGAGLIRRSWSGLFTRLRFAGFEAVALACCLKLEALPLPRFAGIAPFDRVLRFSQAPTLLRSRREACQGFTNL
jgi:hypothetical protein